MTMINPVCPVCGEALEPAGTVSHSNHKLGATTEGAVECPECDFRGILAMNILNTQKMKGPAEAGGGEF